VYPEEPPIDYDIPEEGEEIEEEVDEYIDMTGRQRHLYETAFDCKVNRSDDDLDDVDRVTNHPILHTFANGSNKLLMSSSTASSNLVTPVLAGSSQDPGSSIGVSTPKDRRKVTLSRGKQLKERPKTVPTRVLQTDSASSTTTLSQDLDGLEIQDNEDNKPAPSPLRGYSPSPPSTAPLPAKFHGCTRDTLPMNSIKSAPNLPSSASPAIPRLKDMRLPVKSLRARESPDHRIMEFKGRPRSLFECEEISTEFKERPQSVFQDGSGPILEFKGRPNVCEQACDGGVILKFKDRPSVQANGEGGQTVLEFGRRPRHLQGRESGPILEFKGRPGNRGCGVRPKYSSTESMATSSSGGSLESIRSSTSEGNRSTTSSESHRSSSLSSHSSDSASSCGSNSGNVGNLHHLHHYHHHHSVGTPLGVGSRFFPHQGNKLHILSPISDKSSQEPVSETSDNNRNNNSQKASPEDIDTAVNSPTAPTTNISFDQTPWPEAFGLKPKRRTPQNKNIINLSLQQQSSSSGDVEIQGSDSGISIESRGGNKGCKGFSFLKLGIGQGSGESGGGNVESNSQQSADFSDLPFDMPKLRRRRLLQQDTSGSATSVDLHDLPFDMPKLRRRLRGQQQDAQTSTESSGVSQASSSQSVRDTAPGIDSQLRKG
ncbi:unnamed protein product, partial [Timema podura]|nr:unnamed protein product [Timema podura]